MRAQLDQPGVKLDLIAAAFVMDPKTWTKI
jgi:hypothetical protein